MAREHPYDAIVLDIMLPGSERLQGLRHAPFEEGIWTPILMLTAKDGEFDEAEALDTGADDYVTKPFSYLVLVARLRALIRRGAGERPAILEAGDLRFDPGARRAWRAEVQVELTAREMALLEFLLRHRGEVVSKREILEHVWDYDFEGDQNIVEVYVGHLRNKLDRPFGRAATRDRARRRLPLGGGRRLMLGRMGSIRVRTTAVAVLVVGISLLVAAIAMVAFLDRSLRGRVRTEGIVRAEAIAGELATGASTFTPGDPDEEFVQVLDADGNVDDG